MKSTINLLLLLFFVAACTPDKQSETNVKAFWNRPAESWYEAVPIGNGLLGGMVYGGISSDTIKLNEATLWSGEPADKQNHTANQYLERIRNLLLADRNTEAQKLIDSTMLGPYNECYLPMGDMVIKWDPAGSITNYRRELNLSEGVVRIDYQLDGNGIKREVFASNPDQVIGIKLSGEKKGKISFKTKLTSLLNNTVSLSGNEIILNGQAPLHAYAHYMGKKDPVYADGHGMKFQIRMLIRTKGGSVEESNGQLAVNKADEVEILLTGTTSYNGFEKDPFTEGKDCNAICTNRINQLRDVSFNELKNRHIKDFSGLFGRVSLNLESSPSDTLPADIRIKNYQPGSDPGLTALYYQFGRYLLISCSRPGSQPANLQGIWSDNLQPAWSANWTLNCNAQINYWPVEQGNLPECHLPLIEMTKELSVDGGRTAKNIYHAGGWVAHHNADIWRQTSPVGGTGLWAIYQVGGAWLCHHVWEHYEFTLDGDYLRDVYPLLKGAAQFYLDNLQLDADGYWVTSPAESFENQYRKSDGTVGWACMGPTQDMQIIRDLFTNCIQAATILKMDQGFIDQVSQKLGKLLPMRISPMTGQLQEWKDDWDAADPHGGQVAHGWGLAVGNLISPRETPELAKAFRKTIEYRKPWESYNAGSWVGSFPARFWVRLYDGSMAQTVLDRHFKLAVFPNLTSKFFETFWEIDENLGITASIGEMLIQSHTGEIVLLPALSPKYPNGEVKGLCTRGGFEVDLNWKNGKPVNAAITSKKGGTCKVRYLDKTAEYRMKAGETIKVNGLF
ncbi:MAG: glycoside hydrolase family 95 protein [Porphyromonadaceae bacterium]|nr:MAG: glycoside hydrolase family 95 protein [Porphyromonadaceae bacterium]